MRRYRLFAGVIIVGVLVQHSRAAAESAYQIEWARQFGTAANDLSLAVDVDAAGHVYVAGQTQGNLDGTRVGAIDAFLRKYDAAGHLLWGRQFGSQRDDVANSLAVDAVGNVYVSGTTDGVFGGQTAINSDAFLAKYDAAGSLLWTRLLGTFSFDGSFGVAVDAAGNAYISGYTRGDLARTNIGEEDAFVAKFDAAGNHRWSQQWGSTREDSHVEVAVDADGNSYITGMMDMSATSPTRGDAFVRKYDPLGNSLWLRQLGTTEFDRGAGVDVDADGNVYVSGLTRGSLASTSAGLADAFLMKLDSAGGFVWERQFGAASEDFSESVAVDAAGNVYISGATSGSLGNANAGLYDAFVTKYDPSGDVLWTQQIGSRENDRSWSVAVDSAGRVYFSGDTQGSPFGANAGGHDAFVIKYAPVPEPAALVLVGVSGGVLVGWRRLPRRPATRRRPVLGRSGMRRSVD